MKIGMCVIFVWVVWVRYMDLIRNAVLTAWLTTNLSTYHKYRVLFYCHSYSEFYSSVLLPWFHFSCSYNETNKMRFSIYSNRKQEQLKPLEDSLDISDMGQWYRASSSTCQITKFKSWYCARIVTVKQQKV